MKRPQLDPEVARRVLREKYPYAWAYTLNIRMAEAVNSAAPAFARAAVSFKRAADALSALTPTCRLCGKRAGHRVGCPLARRVER